ncbi:MAG TPA: hypothetical protein VJN22_04450 [Candidatus Eremiobacteraceae bacterium]|nr:hypothetical protein [Candidatus Eremiobacteraceae bacterium]
MRILNQLKALSAAAGILVICACSVDATIGPGSAKDSSHHRVGTFIPPAILKRVVKSYDSCPATGPIEYLSDQTNGSIYIYAGKFRGQLPCGQLVYYTFSAGAIYVDRKTHDLYVPQTEAFSIIVYHRGQTTPYDTYVDPTVEQFVFNVTLLDDGTLVATNPFSYGSEMSSISTWKVGPNGGTFVGNFPIASGGAAWFITAAESGTVYFSVRESYNTDLWTVSCPSGACGTQSRVPGVSFLGGAGLAFDSSGDLVADDYAVGGSNVQTADIFELPNPSPKFFQIANPGGLGIALDSTNRHLFVAQGTFASEYTYPDGQSVGTVRGSFSDIVGVAFDQ